MSVKIICGGESPETRHYRIETEKIDWEQNQSKRERFADPIILGNTPEDQIKNLKFAIGTYEVDLRNAHRRIREMERQKNLWTRADAWLPNRPICVLAWDGETHFISVFESGKWWNAHLDEEIDSVITHWCHLPEPTREQL